VQAWAQPRLVSKTDSTSGRGVREMAGWVGEALGLEVPIPAKKDRGQRVQNPVRESNVRRGGHAMLSASSGLRPTQSSRSRPKFGQGASNPTSTRSAEVSKRQPKRRPGFDPNFKDVRNLYQAAVSYIDNAPGAVVYEYRGIRFRDRRGGRLVPEGIRKLRDAGFTPSTPWETVANWLHSRSPGFSMRWITETGETHHITMQGAYWVDEVGEADPDTEKVKSEAADDRLRDFLRGVGLEGSNPDDGDQSGIDRPREPFRFTDQTQA